MNTSLQRLWQHISQYFTIEMRNLDKLIPPVRLRPSEISQLVFRHPVHLVISDQSKTRAVEEVCSISCKSPAKSKRYKKLKNQLKFTSITPSKFEINKMRFWFLPWHASFSCIISASIDVLMASTPVSLREGSD